MLDQTTKNSGIEENNDESDDSMEKFIVIILAIFGGIIISVGVVFVGIRCLRKQTSERDGEIRNIENVNVDEGQNVECTNPSTIYIHSETWLFCPRWIKHL